MILDDIITWANELPYWQKMISYCIIHSVSISESTMDKIYNAFKIENNLIEGTNDKNIEIEQVKSDNQDGVNVQWRGIQNIQGINALSNNQKLEIGPQLTIVYGKNGSGKSGYSRIFNNAFISRGDKSLLGNIHSNDQEIQNAELIFEVNGENKSTKFPYDTSNQNYGRKVSVFDSVSALSDLTKENELSIAPIEFNFFDNLVKYISEIKVKLETEKAQKKIVNTFSNYFSEETEIKKFISQISGKTNFSILEEKIKISDEETELLKTYTARKTMLEALNIDEKIKQIDDFINNTDRLKEEIRKLNDKISTERLEKIQLLIKNQNNLKILSSEEGIKQFESDQIENLGTPEWKDFIEAAKKYRDTIVETEDEMLDYCILCKQDTSRTNLIEKYWKYLKSESETNLSQANKNIESLLKDFEKVKQNCKNIVHPESKFYEYLKTNNVELLSRISMFEREFRDCVESIINALKEKEWSSTIVSLTFDTECLSSIYKDLKSEKEKTDVEKVNTELLIIKKFLNEYNAKLTAEKFLPQIKNFISNSAWVDKANKNTISTSRITTKQKELFSKYVTDEYVEKFKSECRILKVEFGIAPTQRGAVGTIRNKLTIKGKKPGEILSEGEQRSLALANFLAETGTSTENICVIFDDPVSSLDYERQKNIASRLVELAKDKQVVILTHDLSFMYLLEDFANKESVKYGFQHIQTLPVGKVGIITDNIPWIGMNVKKRLASLRDRLSRMTAEYKRCEEPEAFEKYYNDAKLWCENLRETWERSIEETLLCNAVERYKPSINTQSLKKAMFTKELYPEISSGMQECSDWTHDRARGIGEETPKPEDLEKYLERCNQFIKDNKPA